MDKIFGGTQYVFFEVRPVPPRFNVDLECTRHWTKYSICKMSRPSLHHNIEIGGGGEAARVHEIQPIEYFVHLPSHVILDKHVFHFLFDES